MLLRITTTAPIAATIAMRITATITTITMFAAACIAGTASAEEARKEPVMTAMTVRSSAFEAGAAIPRKHSREGEDVSPPLEWSGVPAGTRELALIVDDPDAPRDHPWVHWVVYGIPAETRSLPAGASGPFQQGTTDFAETRWGGPMPPPGHGVHHYHFKLYALDAPVQAKLGMRKSALLEAMQGHVIGQGELVGTYERK